MSEQHDKQTEPLIDLTQFEGHTPGEWESLNPSPQHQYFRIFGSGSRYIGSICNSDNHDNADEANARLIAAAPTLLAENRRLRERVEELHEWAGFVPGSV